MQVVTWEREGWEDGWEDGEERRGGKARWGRRVRRNEEEAERKNTKHEQNRKQEGRAREERDTHTHTHSQSRTLCEGAPGIPRAAPAPTPVSLG